MKSASAQDQWLVYMGDHHEGPFTRAQVQGLIEQGKITPAYHVWSEGMDEWKPLSEVPELKRPLDASLASPPPPPSHASLPTQRPSFTQGGMPRKASGEAVESSYVTQFGTGGYAITSTTTPREDIADAPVVEPFTPEESMSTSTSDAFGLSAAMEEAKEHSVPSPHSLSQKKSTSLEPDSISIISASPSAQESLAAVRPRPLGTAVSGFEKHEIQKDPSRWIKRVRKLLILILIGGGGYWASQQPWAQERLKDPRWQAVTSRVELLWNGVIERVAQVIPSAGKLLGSADLPEGLSAEDLDRLKKAIKSPLGTSGARVAFTLIDGASQDPTFLIGSNLPEGTQFEVFIKGIRGTLLGRVEYESTSRAIQVGQVARSRAMSSTSPGPLPAGEYQIFIFESKSQPSGVQQVLDSLQPASLHVPLRSPRILKIVATRNLFLGGERDSQYLTRLAQFQNQTREKAKNEIEDLRQFYGTLSTQYKDTFSEFAKLRKQTRGPETVAQWEAFHKKWTPFIDHLSKKFLEWKPETLRESFYFYEVFALTKQSGELISQLHTLQTSFFEGPNPPQDFDSKFASDVMATRNSLLSLREKIAKAQNLKLDEKGLPQKPE